MQLPKWIRRRSPANVGFGLSVILLAGWGYAEEKMIPYVYLNSPEEKPAAAKAEPGKSRPGQAQFPPSGANPQAEEFLRLLRQNQPPGNAPPSQPPPGADPSVASSTVKGQQAGNITKYQGPDGKPRFTLEYREADIQTVIEDISEITGRNFLLDPGVKGPITILSPTPIDAEAVWEVFLSALEVRQYTVVEAGKITKVVQLDKASSSPIKTYSGDYTPGTETFITRLYTLENVSAAEMVASIKPLIKRGDVQAYKQTNTLIITDTGANIKRVIDIIKQLDKEGAREQLEVIPLRYANPGDVADKIRSIYQKEESASSAGSMASRRLRNPSIPGVQTGGGDEEGPLKVTTIEPDERTNSIVVVATEKALQRIRELIAQLDVLIKDPRGNIHVYYLQHANADELAAVLSGSGNTSTPAPTSGSRSNSRQSSRSQSGLTGATGGQNPFTGGSTATGASVASSGTAAIGEGVRITADTNTNSLIVTASQQDFESLKQVIAKLDIPRRQVFVEAVIMELGIDQTRSLGISLSGGGEVNGNPIFGGTAFTPLNPLALDTAALAGLSGLSVAGISKETVTLTLSDGTTTTVPAFSAILQALETAQNVNILSTPNILTTDNEEAEIVVGQNVPFVTSSGRDSNNNPIIQVERKDVAITLRVTPHIKESNYIRLEVFQEITELLAAQNPIIVLNQGPTTTKRSADTTVIVKGEQTVVLGGLIDDKVTISESRVPFLGKIPVLGWLFKSNSKGTRKTNLLIFLTPYIIDGPADFQRILVRKMEERNSFIKRNYGWVQRREIRASLENHQQGLLEVADAVEAKRRARKKAGKVPESVKAASLTERDRHLPAKNGGELHRREVDVDRLLEEY